MKFTIFILMTLVSCGYAAKIDHDFEKWGINDVPAVTVARVIARNRITAGVIAMPDELHMIVRDDLKRDWILTFTRQMSPNFFKFSQVIGLESVTCEGGFVYFLLVPPVGYKWFILLNRIDWPASANESEKKSNGQTSPPSTQPILKP